MLKRHAVGTALTVFGVLLAAAPAAWAHDQGEHHGDGRTLWASPNGGAGPCKQWAPCSLPNAVSAAAAGDKVVALPGVYQGGIVVDKSIDLRGLGAVIDASLPLNGNGNGVQIVGPGGSGSSVEGFTIKNAKFEGILVGTAPVAPSTQNGTPVTTGQPVSDVRIEGNRIVKNDTGFGGTAGQCFSTPNAPGDCGEGIHLVAVTNSVVEHNYVVDNAGGILLTDEFGPTAHNVIRDNDSSNNVGDCGITLAGHSSAAVNPATGQPTGAAGVFDNLIEGNVVNGNGTKGQGAGILMGGGAPFAGVYGNVIRDNFAKGDGLGGVTIHQHFAGDLNGNVIVGNVFINDNLNPDMDFAGIYDGETTGVLVESGLPPLPPGVTVPPPGKIENTVIRDNAFLDNQIGIFTLGVDAGTTTIAHNFFSPGTTPISIN
jgi:Right handed beta helix region